MKAISIALLLVFSVSAALAQSDQAWRLCSSEDADIAIRGCTLLIDAVKLNSKDRSTAFSNRASAYWRKRDYDRVVADVDKALEFNPNNSNAYMRRGAVFSGKGDYDRALADTNKAIEIDPRNFKAYNNRGILYTRQRDYERAIADASKAIQINPKYPNPYAVRGTAYSNKGEDDRAIADFTKAIELNPKLHSAYDARGAAYARKGDFDRSIADATRAIEIDPNFVAAHVNRANGRLHKGDFDGAISDATKAIEIAPNNANAYDNRGFAYLRKGDYDLAIADATKAIQIDPHLAHVYAYRAEAYRRKGDQEPGAADNLQALEPEPKRTTGVAERDADMAIADYAKLIEIEPKNFRYPRALGLLLFVKSDFKGASANLLHALELKDDLYVILFRYLARAHSGERDAAEAELAESARRWKVRVWPYALIELYLGKRSPEAMLDAAVKRSDRCMVQFHVGEWHALRSQSAEALTALRGAAEICSRDSFEYRAAGAELARLTP
jgi:tetratricopeptide (TPR) repeat protein